MSFTPRALRIVATALSLALLSPALAAPPHSEPASNGAMNLLRSGTNDTTIYRDHETGTPTFLGGQLPAVRAHVATPLAAAQAFFAENGGLFRMSNAKAELSLVRDEHDGVGMNHVRFQQRYNGVEVFGGMLVAHTRGVQIVSVTGNYFPGLNVDTQPNLSIDQAAEKARAAVHAPHASVVSGRSGLVVYAKNRPALAWKIELLDGMGENRWQMFVDAHSGRIIHTIALAETARNHSTYTMNNNAQSADTPLPGTKLCDEANASGCASDPVAKAAHDNAGFVYDYYLNTFGRDSLDNKGLELKSSVHYDVDYDNAFWNGDQMVYGDGDGVLMSPLSQALDVVAHELTHGLTQYTAGLVYENESGALNESYSDVMGTFADAYHRGTTQVDWQLGEQIWTPSISGDALRDMSDPHLGNDPFTNDYNCQYRVGQPFYCGQPANMSEIADLPINVFEEVPSDSGGVHINSGIPNKIAYLMTQGGTFGGVTVAGIGVAKAEQIYYRTLTSYLTPYSNFLDARNSSIQACKDLVGKSGITANDCASVKDAFKAAGIDMPPEFANKLFIPLAAMSANNAAFTGVVTLNKAPAAGVTVQLQRCFNTCDSIATATTNANGRYSFATSSSIPATDDQTLYRVAYINPSKTPNGKMFAWFSDDIQNYTQGQTITVDTFDIGDVTYLSPNSTTPQSYPVTFTWTPRQASDDYYIWEAYDTNFKLIASENLFLMHKNATFALSGASDKQLMSGSKLTGATAWDVIVVSKAGFGITYNTGVLAIAGANTQNVDWYAARQAQVAQLLTKLHPIQVLDSGADLQP